MNELKKRWFQIVWAGLTLCSLVFAWIRRGVDAQWVQSRAFEVLSDVLGWIVLVMTVVLFVVHCIENYHTGRRYFWRICRRWGSALFWGVLMASVLVVVVKYFKSGGAFAAALPDKEVNIFLFVLLSLGGVLYMIAKYKYNHPNKD